MARKIFLHIGAAKTGSSAIQAFIRANLDYFAAQNFVIPDHVLGLGARIPGNHVMPLQELITAPDASRLRVAFKGLREGPEADKTVLISAENLSNPGAHRYFTEALDGFDATVILYIRRQDELLTSAWQQWHSKIGDDFQAWLIKGLQHDGHWDRVIADWESIVGKGRVTVRLFEPEAMVGGDLRRDFLHCLGLDASSTAPEFDSGPVNSSYSDIITSLVAGNRDIFENVHDNAFYQMIGEMTGDTYVEKRKVSLLSRAQRDNILLYYHDINARVCAAHFPDRATLFSPVQHAKYQYLSADEVTARQLKFLTHLIYKLSQKAGGIK